MGIIQFLIISASAYLLGSLNFSIIICRLTLHKDIRAYGSGNAGLTNSYRMMGMQKTLLVLLGDVLKAVAAVSIGGYFGGTLGKLIAGIFVIIGHSFPAYFGFRGGKGVLVGATMLCIVDWRIFLIAFSIFVLTVAITRWISLGSILGAVSFPISMQFFHGDIRLTAIAAGMAAAIIYFHRSNIFRICNGRENRFSFHVKPKITRDKNE